MNARLESLIAAAKQAWAAERSSGKVRLTVVLDTSSVARGAEETMDYDEDYIRALEHGLPPTAGFGMGIDRLTMALTAQESIREVILFPLLRPER